MRDKYDLLKDLMVIAPSHRAWMMLPGERFAVIGLLHLLKPSSILEFGSAFGGLTEWLCSVAANVVTVDIDPRVLELSKEFPNIVPLHMTTEEAFRKLEKENAHFDLCVVDADHSVEGARGDLQRAMKLADIVLVHDTYHPACREGYLKALADADVYYELDLVDGHIQTDGMWTGLGIVIPSFPSSLHDLGTPKLPNYPFIEKAFRRKEFARKAVKYFRG